MKRARDRDDESLFCCFYLSLWVACLKLSSSSSLLLWGIHVRCTLRRVWGRMRLLDTTIRWPYQLYQLCVFLILRVLRVDVPKYCNPFAPPRLIIFYCKAAGGLLLPLHYYMNSQVRPRSPHCLSNIFKFPGQDLVFIPIDVLGDCPNTTVLGPPCRKALTFVDNFIGLALLGHLSALPVTLTGTAKIDSADGVLEIQLSAQSRTYARVYITPLSIHGGDGQMKESLAMSAICFLGQSNTAMDGRKQGSHCSPHGQNGSMACKIGLLQCLVILSHGLGQGLMTFLAVRHPSLTYFTKYSEYSVVITLTVESSPHDIILSYRADHPGLYA